MAEAIDTHLSRIYAREVKRVGPDRLMGWWADVDGCGTTIDQWMAETVAPLLLTLGQLDLAFDHPAAPEGEEIETRADAERLGLDRCVASYILPENMLWWRLDATGHRYAECLVREFHEVGRRPGRAVTATGPPTSRPSTTPRGRSSRSRPHPFGRVPIVRVFDRRKPRCKNIGQPRYEGVAERQREYYNRDSELILSDTTQAHPLLQGPEDFVQADGTIPIGPSWLLPKKKNTQGGATTYEGFDVVDFPKDGAESIRKNKADIRDDVDRDSALVRPTGRDGRGAVGPFEGVRPRRRQQPAGQDRQDPRPGRGADRRAGADRPRRRRARPAETDRRSSIRPSSTCSRRATWPPATGEFQQLAASRGPAGHRGPDARPADAALPARAWATPSTRSATPSCRRISTSDIVGARAPNHARRVRMTIQPPAPTFPHRSGSGRGVRRCGGGVGEFGDPSGAVESPAPPSCLFE